MTPTQQVVVEPERLKGMSTDVTRAAELLSSAYAESESDLAPNDQAGWAAQKAAAKAKAVWGDFITTLRRSVSGLANDFNTAAGEYVGVDEGSATRFGDIGGRRIPQ